MDFPSIAQRETSTSIACSKHLLNFTLLFWPPELKAKRLHSWTVHGKTISSEKLHWCYNDSKCWQKCTSVGRWELSKPHSMLFKDMMQLEKPEKLHVLVYVVYTTSVVIKTITVTKWHWLGLNDGIFSAEVQILLR